ncbi:hypothetical protein ES288_A13G162100v1 [Gossypium darwinii]|uniref:Uncharacterized protein n=2 Tax=Gossypium TaxID=3633 RepID=A0A5D2MKZ6_GOSTO|nr:hypothetical protein ES288_A13G162100v1 [Gossypium darwinii]TYH92191.1 hypothetical protein ES332_A13G164900v1 [Gossypium tomentosum]
MYEMLGDIICRQQRNLIAPKTPMFVMVCLNTEAMFSRVVACKQPPWTTTNATYPDSLQTPFANAYFVTASLNFLLLLNLIPSSHIGKIQLASYFCPTLLLTENSSSDCTSLS